MSLTMLSWVSRVSGKQTGQLSLEKGKHPIVDDSTENDDFVLVDIVGDTKGPSGTAADGQHCQEVAAGMQNATGQTGLKAEDKHAIGETQVYSDKEYIEQGEQQNVLTAADIPFWLTARMNAIFSCHDIAMSSTSPFLSTHLDLSNFEYDFQLERETISREESQQS